jgi:uncharacterized protein (TIGR02246 family)
LFLALGLVALVASAEQPQAREKEEPGKARRGAFIAAFNKGDAKAVAAFWTPDATYVDHFGHEYKGRPAIQRLYEKVFAAHKGAKLSIQITSAKELTPDVALEDGVTAVTLVDGSPASAGRFSAVLLKKDGEWYLQSVHDSTLHSPSNAEHLEDLEWLIGEWAGETDKSESSRASFHWAENQNFIITVFLTTLRDRPVAGGTQWIGWDAVEKQIRSWTFYSAGGFAEAVWTKDGEKWSLQSTARLANGKKASATHLLTRIDDDHFTWQRTRISVDGEKMPDATPVKMKRVQAAQP